MTNTSLTYNATEKILVKLIPELELKPKSIEDVMKLPSFLSKIRECEEIYSQKYSVLDHAVQDALVLRRLQQMINTLKLNPLWNERITNSGIRGVPQNFDEWQELPISDKNTLSQFYMGARPGLVVPLSKGGFEIVASGGTSSGKPVETVYSLQELQDTYKIAGDFMGRHVLKDYLAGSDPKWIVNLYSDYQMWSSGTMVGGVLQEIPNSNFIGAGPILKEVFQHMMTYKGPKAILGMTQALADLSDFGIGLSEEVRESFCVALYCSGVLPHRKKLELKERYPNLKILSYFSATQAEAIGVQLNEDSNYLASVPGLFFIEIVDENGRWVEEGQEGDFVITRLHTHRAPLLRFKLGDRMIRRPNITRPDLNTRQFEFLGRSGDVIHLWDTQYAAPETYKSLCLALNQAYVFDLDALAHEIQFVNHRKDRLLTLIASVDNGESLTYRMNYILGVPGIRRLFIESLTRSLSIFNEGEANFYTIEKTGYRFQIKFVSRDSPEILRTSLGKVALIRDVF